jgi:hypothetical protein
MLGHSSIAVTERYAHHAGTRLRAAADRMRVGGYEVVTGSSGNGGGASTAAAITNDFNHLEGVGRAGHDPATYGLKVHSSNVNNQTLTPGQPPDFGYRNQLARKLLELVASGQTAAALAVAVSMAAEATSTASTLDQIQHATRR